MNIFSQNLSAQDSAIAQVALEKIAVQHPQNQEMNLTLPAPAIDLLREMLEAMVLGKSVAVLPLETELSSFELANVLNVSRPYAIGLLEKGLIPFRSVGVHRRIRLDDALRYKAEQRQRSLEAMAALQAENEALGLQ
jgi:excisionase family DNA binding protein